LPQVDIVIQKRPIRLSIVPTKTSSDLSKIFDTVVFVFVLIKEAVIEAKTLSFHALSP